MIEFDPESPETARALGAFLGRKLQEKKMAILDRFFQSERAEIFEKAKNRKAMSEENKPSAGVPEGCLPFDAVKAIQGWPLKCRNGDRAEFIGENDHPEWKIRLRMGPGISRLVRKDGTESSVFGNLSEYDAFLVADYTPPGIHIIDTTASAGWIVKLLDPDERQQIIDLVAEHFGLRAAAAEPETVAETEAGTEEPWVVTPAIDLCLRLLIRAAFDVKRNKKASEIKADLAPLFTPEEIARAHSLAKKGVIPPPMDLEWYHRK